MSEIGSIQPEPEFAALIGIDWADQKHVWCCKLQAQGSVKARARLADLMNALLPELKH
jgi:hypothetical protein